MAGTKKWREVRRTLSPEREKRIEAAKDRMRGEMRLHELRRARELTQETLAKLLGLSQPTISQIEQQADAYVSTLRRYVEAMGGELEIVARFPEGAVRITQFQAPS